MISSHGPAPLDFEGYLSARRLLAADLWRQTGSQWEQENQDDLKDKMDFLLAPPALYPAGGESQILHDDRPQAGGS